MTVSRRVVNSLRLVVCSLGRAIGRAVDEFAHHGKRDVGFQQRDSHFAHCGADIFLGQRTATAKTIEDTANCGGPSVAVTLTRTLDATRDNTVMLLGYGVGLSWGSALLPIRAGTPLLHGVLGEAGQAA